MACIVQGGKYLSPAINALNLIILFIFGTVPYAKTARILIAMSIPGNILFILAADYINMNTTTVTWVFMLSYLIASLIQVSLDICMCMYGITYEN